MAETTEIAWCDATWSPWEGCQKVGPGCDNCYAEARNKRFAAGANWGPGAPRRRTVDWTKPRLWNRAAAQAGRRMKVFPSLCDPFDNAVPTRWLWDFVRLIIATPHLDWLLLSKRIGNARAMLNEAVAAAWGDFVGAPAWDERPLFNVWLGATVVDQTEADRDIPKLLAIPSRGARFLSIEPMLGPIDITPFLWGKHAAVDSVCQNCPRDADCECGYHTRQALKLPPLSWVICGGESGPHARPMHPEWPRSLRDQCDDASVPFLFKQHGEWVSSGEPAWSRVTGKRVALLRPDGSIVPDDSDEARDEDANVVTMSCVGKAAAGRLLDGRTHDQFPEVHS